MYENIYIYIFISLSVYLYHKILWTGKYAPPPSITCDSRYDPPPQGPYAKRSKFNEVWRGWPWGEGGGGEELIWAVMLKSVYILTMSCLCLFYVLSMSCLCLVFALSMSCLCLVYVLSMSCLCLVYVLSMSCLCLVYILFMSMYHDRECSKRP